MYSVRGRADPSLVEPLYCFHFLSYLPRYWDLPILAGILVAEINYQQYSYLHNYPRCFRVRQGYFRPRQAKEVVPKLERAV